MDVMQIDDEKKNDIFKWDDSATRLLLGFYRKAIKNIGKTSLLKTKQQLWIHIVEELSKYGFGVSPKQVQNRLITLERSFKKRFSEGSVGGLPVKTALYDDEIKEIIESRKNCPFGIDVADLSFDNNTIFNDSEEFESANNHDHSSLKPYLDSNRWDPESTKLFIDAFMKTITNSSKMRGFKTKKKMWLHISQQINAHGFEFTERQTRNRLSTLIRAYKKHLEKKRFGVRSFFMFEKEVHEMIKHKICSSNRETDSDYYDDDDDNEGGENEFEINIIDIDENNIDNVAIPTENESPNSKLPQKSSLNFQSSVDLPSSSNSTTVSENYTILNELRLLRRGKNEFHSKLLKMEEEKLDLMRQNNILLKILIEKVSKKS